MTIMMESRKQTDRGKLVRIWGEDFSISQIHEKAPGHKISGRGIYALYKDDKLVYTGIAKKSIRGRLKDHLRDKLKGKWNKFSFYQVKKTQYIKDIETLILRIGKPKLNTVKGTFRSKCKVK